MTPGLRGEENGEERREREEGEPGPAKGESEQGGGGRNARPEERTSECGRELVRAGAFPRANFRVRDGGGEERGEKQRECDRDQARKRGRKREKERERERERGEGEIEIESSEQQKRRSRPPGSEMGRKFSSGAFICSSNEMRMHYTWIAGDINFLPWTCSGPRATGQQQGRVLVRGRVAGVVERRGGG